ncbi:hypothetical protein ANN_08541 [Periplaneta americana]|uniref:Uncharacterized protein n=1 Tax=Periplaneta americana TaxID=6978 RepID=A0ABQ8T3Y2_PERAM|nr:hypothetical protein ANN_08541 [Periplaneta americana]
MERSLTPVSERVGVVGRKQGKCTASHNVLVSRIFAAAGVGRRGQNSYSNFCSLHGDATQPPAAETQELRDLAVWFQKDGAIAHTAKASMNLLREMFPGTCRTSSLALPPERALLDLLVRDQALLQPMNVSHLPPANQLPRRHSAHCCPPEHKPSMVSAQPPPIPLRPPAVPERSKIGPPPPISGVRFTSTQGSGHPYLKQMPSTLTQQQNLPQQSQHQKPIQPPIPPPHIPHQSKSQQQPIKNINTQLPMKQKPLKPKILPSIPPQSHTLHQQSQAQQPNKQPQSGTLKVAGSSQVPQNKQPTSLQSQIQQSLNQSQLQQLQQSKMSQPQSHMTQNLGKQAINMQQQIQPQSLNQSQMPQTLKQQQNQNSQIHTKQSNIPSQQSQQSQKPTMTQPIQNQQQMTVASTRVEQQITQQSFSNACNNKISVRQDSNVSSDSFSQNSSPSYTTKTMETPLLPHHAVNSKNASNQYQKVGGGGNKKILNSSHGDSGNGTAVTGNDVSSNGNAALTKSISTPASLQTIVRFHHGSNMSLHHRVTRLRGNESDDDDDDDDDGDCDCDCDCDGDCDGDGGYGYGDNGDDHGANTIVHGSGLNYDTRARVCSYWVRVFIVLRTPRYITVTKGTVIQAKLLTVIRCAHTNVGRGSDSETCNLAIAAKFVLVFTPKRDTVANRYGFFNEEVLLHKAGIKKNRNLAFDNASARERITKVTMPCSHGTVVAAPRRFLLAGMCVPFTRGAQCDVHSRQCTPLPFGVRNQALFENDLVVLVNQKSRRFRFEERAGQGVGPPQPIQRS